MMIRILSVLPAVMGVICALLVVVSLYGPTLDASRTDIPLVPCTDDAAGCPVGMTSEDLVSPTCLLYTSPSPRDYAASRMPSSA